MLDFRIGNGYDVHRLVEDRDLFLGCVKIPHTKGLLGHSDADVLCHAIADALLGAIGKGDIGVHFPDNDPSFSGASGAFILEKTLEICKTNGYLVSNVDSIIVAQKPKLAPFLPQMRENIAKALEILPEQVNIKATTEEKLGFTGTEEGMGAHAVCIMVKK